jgi:hypothetical protein
LLDFLCQLLWDIASIIAEIYAVTSGWITPFNLISRPFYTLYFIVQNIALKVLDFNIWVTNIASQVLTFISWNNLTSWFSKYLDMIIYAWNWVVKWWDNVWYRINAWWEGIWPTIQGWISSATQGLSGLLADFLNFTKNILPTLMTVAQWTLLWPLKLLEITGLIDSAFLTREGFWKGWQEVRDNVIGFITNPLDFLLDKFSDWFLGKE